MDMVNSRKEFTVLTAITAVVLLQVALACFSPADPYAIEVVLNKPGVSYDLSRLQDVAEVEYAGGKAYAYRSHYDARLVVLLSEQELFGGRYLSVRLQVPIREEESTIYRCKLPISRCSMEIKIGKVLEVEAGSGEATLDLGVISFKNPAFVIFKPVLRAEGKDVNLTVSGVLVLEGTTVAVVGPDSELIRTGGHGAYRIMMPCILSQNTACYRVMMLIPGYDSPLRVEEGAYKANLTLSWHSSGKALLFVEELQVRCEREMLPQPLPPPGWKLEGSILTRNVSNAQIRVDINSGACEIVVPGVAGVSQEAESDLRNLLASLGFENITPTYEASRESRVIPSIEVGEEEVKAALKGELEWLVKNEVVEGLNDEDVEAIAAAAKLGFAGWNGRLVLHNGSWVPYSSVPGATLIRCFTGAAEVFRSDSSTFERLKPAQSKPQEVAHVSLKEQPSSTPGALQSLMIGVAVALAVAAFSYIAVKKVFAR